MVSWHQNETLAASSEDKSVFTSNPDYSFYQCCTEGWLSWSCLCVTNLFQQPWRGALHGVGSWSVSSFNSLVNARGLSHFSVPALLKWLYCRHLTPWRSMPSNKTNPTDSIMCFMPSWSMVRVQFHPWVKQDTSTTSHITLMKNVYFCSNKF